MAHLHRNHSARIVQQATRPRVYVGGSLQGRGMSPQTLLAFEHRWPRHSGHKEEQIRRELGITPARYYQLLSRAARARDGIAADPITARRVRSRGTLRKR